MMRKIAWLTVKKDWAELSTELGLIRDSWGNDPKQLGSMSKVFKDYWQLDIPCKEKQRTYRFC